MADDEGGTVTLGELGRRMDKLEVSVADVAKTLGGKIDSLQFVHRDTYNAEMAAVRADVKELKDSKQFFSRSLLVSFIMPILVAVILGLALTR